jgi:WD40 repeat protein
MQRLILLFFGIIVLFVLLYALPLHLVALILGIVFTTGLVLSRVIGPWQQQLRGVPVPTYRFFVYLSIIAFLGLGTAALLYVKFSETPPLPSPLEGHTTPVNMVVMSATGEKIASVGSDHFIRIWNVRKNALELPIPTIADNLYSAYPDAFTCVAFSPDDLTFAFGSADKTIRLWNIRENSMRQLVGHAGSIKSIASSPDGTLLASASDDKTVRLWRIVDGSVLNTFQKNNATTNALVFSPDGQMLATGTTDGWIRIWKIDGTAIREIQAHSESILTLAYSLDGQFLFSISDKRILRKWRLSDGILVADVFQDRKDSITAATFSRDTNLVATADSDKTIRLWNTNGAFQRNIGTAHGEPITNLMFDTTGTRLVSGSKDDKLGIWNVADGNAIRTQGIGADVNAVTFSHDGNMVAFVTEDKRVIIAPLRSESALYRFNGLTEDIVQIAFTNDSTNLVSITQDGFIRVWRIADGKLQHEIVWKPNTLTSLATNPVDPNWVAVGNEKGAIRFWHFGTDESRITNVYTETIALSSIAYSPDGKLVAAGSEKSIRLIKMDGTLVKELESTKGQITSLIFSPDGKKIAASNVNGNMTLWSFSDSSLTTQTLVIPLARKTSNAKPMWFANNGQTLITGGIGKTLHVWDTTDGKQIDELPGYAPTVNDLKILYQDNKPNLYAVGLDASNLQVWQVANANDLQGRWNLYWLGRFFLGADLLRLFWAIVLGFSAPSLLILSWVLVSSWASARSFYSQYPGYSFSKALGAVFSIELGVHRAQVLISKGEIIQQRAAVGALAELAGPGMLIVEEGHAAVLMRHGDITRVVGNGITWLSPYEFVHMPIYLAPQVTRLGIDNVLTLDNMMIDQIEIAVTHRVDRGDQSRASGQFYFDPQLIREKIWSPEWKNRRGNLDMIIKSTTFDIIAQYKFADIVSIAGDARQHLIHELTIRLDVQTREIGIETMDVQIGAIKIPSSIRNALERKSLGGVDR